MFQIQEAAKAAEAKKAADGKTADATADANPSAEPAGNTEAIATVPRTGCGAECFNRTCLTTCDPRVCPCGPSCSNRPFHQLKSPKTDTTLTENRGWGLFLAEPVKAGTFIVEYVGEILDEHTEKRLWEDKKRGEDNFYLMGDAQPVHRRQVQKQPLAFHQLLVLSQLRDAEVAGFRHRRDARRHLPFRISRRD